MNKCTRLEVLYLQNNLLTEIDLTPLQFNKNLRVINLDYNLLKKLILPKTSQWDNVEELRLYSNYLEKINLNALEQCKKMREIDLGDNLLSKINLNPLYNYTKINSISLERNKLKVIDLSSLDKKQHSYVLCTDPNVKLKRFDKGIKKETAKIVYSKGEYYSEEQETIINQFLNSEKEEKKLQRDDILNKTSKKLV